MIFVNNQSQLNETCQKLASEKVLYMDTEFDRRKTYYAILSIVQISTHDQKIIIDGLAKMDLSPLKSLLDNPQIIKVFHSPDQDFDIFLQAFGSIPVNIFDTQIAANVCGMDEGMGYSKLCKLMLNIEIDKSFQKANWLDRPLSNKLLEYAIRDTEFLIPLHRILSETMTSRKLWDNYKARSAKLCDINSYKFSPERILQKMRLRNKTSKFMDNLIHFINLREECAKVLNVPRGHCASDDDLLTICSYLPTNTDELKKYHLSFLPIAKAGFKDKIFDLCAGLKE
jgi:ribonuclease D